MFFDKEKHILILKKGTGIFLEDNDVFLCKDDEDILQSILNEAGVDGPQFVYSNLIIHGKCEIVAENAGYIYNYHYSNMNKKEFIDEIDSAVSDLDRYKDILSRSNEITEMFPTINIYESGNKFLVYVPKIQEQIFEKWNVIDDRNIKTKKLEDHKGFSVYTIY